MADDATDTDLLTLTALVHEDEDGGYWAEVAELPGAITQGDTEAELESNLQEAIALMLETVIEDYLDSIKDPVPPDEAEIVWRMGVRIHRVKTEASKDV